MECPLADKLVGSHLSTEIPSLLIFLNEKVNIGFDFQYTKFSVTKNNKTDLLLICYFKSTLKINVWHLLLYVIIG